MENTTAHTTKKLFSRTTTVAIDIAASQDVVWTLLTSASHYPDWNSTVVSIDGDINPGGLIKLKSNLDPKRTFKLKIKDFKPNSRLVWGDAMGNRVYSLKENDEGTHVTMTEKIGGPLLPLFASKIPSFDASFDQFMKDLKTEAEKHS